MCSAKVRDGSRVMLKSKTLEEEVEESKNSVNNGY